MLKMVLKKNAVIPLIFQSSNDVIVKYFFRYL